MAFDRKCYFLVGINNLKWDEAKERCEQQSGTLACFENESAPVI